MAALSAITNATPLPDWVTSYNSLTTFVGDLAGLDSGITDNTSPDTLVEAINYVYGIAAGEITDFGSAVTFEDTINVQGVATFENNVLIEGSLAFNDTGSATITNILDEDNMASDSATALATQQSVKAYVDATAAAIDAVTLGGLSSSQFLRSDASDVIDNDITLTFGDSTLGSLRISHVSATDELRLIPHNGTSFNVANMLGWLGSNGYWKFAGEMRVGGAFASLGIDDNASSNKIQIETSAITLKTATEVQGDLTVSTSGHIYIPNATATQVSNQGGEYIEFDGTNENVDIYSGSVIGFRSTPTFNRLFYAGSAKFDTTSTGVSVTGGIALTGNITGGSTVQLKNSGDDYIDITASTVDCYVNTIKRLSVTAGGIAVIGSITSSSDITAFSSDERIKTVYRNTMMENDPFSILAPVSGIMYKFNENAKSVDPTADLEMMRYGLLAQEVEQTMPELIGPDFGGYKTVKYDGLIPVLVNAVKLLDARVKELEDV